MTWPETVSKEDLEITFFRGSGGGGQHRNKNDTACRLKHLPTGIIVEAQDNKSQYQNKKAAFRRLCKKLLPLMKQEMQGPTIKRRTKRIRTYNEKHNRVVDSRISNKTFSYEEVLNGKGLHNVLEELVRNKKE